MKKRIVLYLFLLLAVATACGGTTANTETSPCVPAFREVSAEPIRAHFGSWRITFNVALIGCAANLEMITKEALAKLANEFQEQEKWSDVLVINGSKEESFRTQAVIRLNEVLGQDVVTDVLFHSISLLDDNRPSL